MPLHILQDSSPHQGKAVMLQRVYYHCVSKEKRKKKMNGLGFLVQHVGGLEVNALS